MKLADLKINTNNPQKFDDLSKLENSIKEFPKMMELRPIVTDANNMVLGGNKRLICLQNLGYKEIPDTWVKRAEDLTEAEQQRFIIADNVGFGEWDMDVLEGWDKEDLEEWGLELEWETVEKEQHDKLEDKFIIPPFSVLDTRKGYWQERKRYWKELIGDGGESREGALSESELMGGINSGVSLLDPVLAEISNRWFGIKNCNTFDPFAGDSVFGYVSDALGNKFTGIELRMDQTDLNNQRIKGSNSKYICDDGQNVLKHIKENSQDLLFSCPPYFDLEVYSDLKNDASNQKEYADFLKIVNNAFSDSIKCLKDNRFAVITVGDIRNKEGFYYGFVDDIKSIFKANNMSLYNELIIVETLGTLPQRVGRYMNNRKVGKCHQNVLVFYKGNPKEIKNIYPKLDFTNIEDESTDI
jgi:DNA modification methylase